MAAVNWSCGVGTSASSTVTVQTQLSVGLRCATARQPQLVPQLLFLLFPPPPRPLRVVMHGRTVTSQ